MQISSSPDQHGAPAKKERYITGRRAIAEELGRCENTVSGMIAAGRLRAVKLNGITSPWTVRMSEIERVRNGE